MICAQAMMHFRAKESYEKYLKLLVSAMILIQLFWPVAKLLSGNDGSWAEDILEELGREMEQGMRTAEENAAAADVLLEQMTLEELKSYMERPPEETDGGEEIGIEVETIDPVSIGETMPGE